MRKYIGAALFVLLINYCCLGLTAAPKLLNKGLATIHLSFSVFAAQASGTVPVGLPTGTIAVAHSATIVWTADAGTVAGYNVYRSTASGGEAGQAALNGATLITGTTYTDTTVSAGATYFYVVAAQASTGQQSGFSNEASGTVPTDVPNPPNPSGCAVSTK
jgi:fibronectin type 3 domain-containing protein